MDGIMLFDQYVTPAPRESIAHLHTFQFSSCTDAGLGAVRNLYPFRTGDLLEID